MFDQSRRPPQPVRDATTRHGLTIGLLAALAVAAPAVGIIATAAAPSEARLAGYTQRVGDAPASGPAKTITLSAANETFARGYDTTVPPTGYCIGAPDTNAADAGLRLSAVPINFRAVPEAFKAPEAFRAVPEAFKAPDAFHSVPENRSDGRRDAATTCLTSPLGDVADTSPLRTVGRRD